MPWNNPIEYPFNMHGVKENAPAESGVYALCDGDKWIYLGASDNLQHALLAHLDRSAAAYLKARRSQSYFWSSGWSS